MDVTATVLLLSLAVPVLLSADSVGSKARSCADVRQFYSGKGFTLNGVPQSEISGEHLRVCPQGYTCCTSAMEETLVALSRRELEGLVREAGRSIQATLNAQYRSFDTYFLELLDGSERWLESEFPEAVGGLYERNAGLFRDLYGDLRRFYRGTPLSLDEALDDLWTRLLERRIKATPNITMATDGLTDDFLECGVKQAEALQLYGEAPRQMKTALVPTLITARAFTQALTSAGEVVRKVSQVPLSAECNRAIMKLVYCGQCRGLGGLKPCPNYCTNVMKGCLANQADLQAEWESLIDALLEVAASFGASPGLDSALFSIPVRISEGLLSLQDGMDTFRSKVWQACGTPTVEPTESAGSEDRRKRSITVLHYKSSSTAAVRLEVQVSDVSSKLKEMLQFWLQLPAALCKSKAASSTDRCWNGNTKARYLPEVIGDGLASQINNPEVDVDITKPDMSVRQQIMQLKITTSRLLTALSGQDVDFQDNSDDISGSGSGLCLGQACVHSRVLVSRGNRPRYYTPENKRVKGTANQGLPCNNLVLLSLASVVLLRR
ncbi:glypican-1 [Alosa sapidissima]|uniref:glypican-1 n=1 Tax=Alosa sapidissima TaxID=34773 RepID=UPI001C083703|nr:glypican-1 [Alosa sapidissima]XP_041912699.1 glypican-1 [Alosa sapidissima]